MVEIRAVKGVNLKVEDGEIVSVVGPSGCGKTTLLNIASTMDRISEGDILYNDRRIDNINEKMKSRLRLNEFEFVFHRFQLLQTLNVYDNIVMPLAFNNKRIDSDMVNSIIDMLGLGEKKDILPQYISGGEQQRVARMADSVVEMRDGAIVGKY